MSAGQDWVEQARRLVEVFRAGADGPAAGATGSSGSSGSSEAPGTAGEGLTGDCRWCPLCQAAAVLRGERPEVSAALADVLTATATALRSLAGEPAPAADPAEEPAPQERPAPAVQEIELS